MFRKCIDLREIPKELKKRLEFVPVKHMREALEHVLVTPLAWTARPPMARTAPSAMSAAPAQVRSPRD